MGIEQTDLLLSEGANPERVVIGHLDGSSDIGYHLAVLDKGVSIAFDRLGLPGFTSEEGSLACLLGLIGIGKQERIMISHDNIWFFLGHDAIEPNPAYIFENVVPRLKKAGITDEMIDSIMTDNVRHLFGG